MNAYEEEIMSVGGRIPIPSFDEETLYELCRDAEAILKRQNILLEISPPVYVIGDLHGNLHDLLRIFTRIPKYGFKILFLGDYIDRGSYSIEVITVILTLLCKFPDNVSVIRGNHEFPNVCQKNPFVDEIVHTYKSEALFNRFQEVFCYMPLAAIIDKVYFCVHGGIGPDLKSISDIKKIQRPIRTYKDNSLVCDLLWADPCKSISGFMTSTRGVGNMFGFNAATQFLEDNKLQKLIRAHQCVTTGIVQTRNVITVFSSSFYNQEENKAGFLFVDEMGEIQDNYLNAHLNMSRQAAAFQNAPTRAKPSIGWHVIPTSPSSTPTSASKLKSCMMIRTTPQLSSQRIARDKRERRPSLPLLLTSSKPAAVNSVNTGLNQNAEPELESSITQYRPRRASSSTIISSSFHE